MVSVRGRLETCRKIESDREAGVVIVGASTEVEAYPSQPASVGDPPTLFRRSMPKRRLNESRRFHRRLFGGAWSASGLSAPHYCLRSDRAFLKLRPEEHVLRLVERASGALFGLGLEHRRSSKPRAAEPPSDGSGPQSNKLSAQMTPSRSAVRDRRAFRILQNWQRPHARCLG